MTRPSRGAWQLSTEHEVFVLNIKKEEDDEDLKAYPLIFGNGKILKI